jgi:nicotinamide-nucleotide amidase
LQHQTLVVFPGVPAELKAIFDSSFQPTLSELLGESAFIEKKIVTDCSDESILAPVIKYVTERADNVYVKTLVDHFGNDGQIKVLFSARRNSKEEARSSVDEAFAILEKALILLGIKIIG